MGAIVVTPGMGVAGRAPRDMVCVPAAFVKVAAPIVSLWVPPTVDLTKVWLSAARLRLVVKPGTVDARVTPVTAGPALSILQTASPSAKRPMKVRLSAVTVADREMGRVGLKFRTWATVPLATLKLTPVGEPEKSKVMAIVFPLNDLFESEEFDNLPPDYYIPGKKMQLFFWGLVSWIIAHDQHLLG
ncbi:hypothetical protein [Microcystis aeruginosa]|uniref:hypothetical protein n=2 Tax=Microcystis aeruginosa TaxID=1126 RepID=UPI00232C5DB4|nr:hypothetical protein [Microcystis aeruginosa]MDB9431744.1 hypothetical protein [Microcystis aeruginosa CS-552/01]